MKILILGSGGREHAFAQLITQNNTNHKVWIAPGNGGTSECGTNVNIDIFDFEAVYHFAKANGVDIILPGGEDTLVAGITDFIEEKNRSENSQISVAGPSMAAAQLEGSKDFSKAFMHKYGIPTAKSFTTIAKNIDEGKQFLESLQPPFVLKADGLAAGKGVIITNDIIEAKSTLDDMILNAKFGTASSKVVIEEFLHGIEISVFAISDGKDWQVLASAKDYKRIGVNDTGLNTGGMGAISPVPFADEQFMHKVKNQIIAPTFNGMRAEGMPFKGFLFIGLMNCGGEPFVIEYNVRMGDPETEAIFPRLITPMADIVNAIANKGMNSLEITVSNKTAATVFLVSGGYPGDIAKGKIMQIPQPEGETWFFHSGTKRVENSNNSTSTNHQIVTNGGRVLAITSIADDLQSARQKSMDWAEKITFEGKYYRTDIGLDLL